MKDKIFSLITGIIFGFGLVVSGMTNPEKVIGFLSITHNWDASLIFVMGGAIIITSPMFYLANRSNTSFLNIKFQLPEKKNLNKKLIIGSSLFGVGWGLSGLCPGPAISSIALFDPLSLVFFISMLLGILVSKYI